MPGEVRIHGCHHRLYKEANHFSVQVMRVHRVRGARKAFQLPRGRVAALLLGTTYLVVLIVWKGVAHGVSEDRDPRDSFSANIEKNNEWSGFGDREHERPRRQPPPRHTSSPQEPLETASKAPKEIRSKEIERTSEKSISPASFSLPQEVEMQKRIEKGDGTMKKSRGRAIPVLTSPSEKPSGKTQDDSCRIYVWDLGKDVAPDIGMSICNITDIWPFDHPGRGIEGMHRTAHQDAPHATGYWLVNAIRGSKYYENSIDKADLIVLDTHCYESWYYAGQHTLSKYEDGLDPINDISLDISRLFVEGVTSSLHFTRSKGKKFVLVRPTIGSPPGVMLDTCAKFRSSFFVASERGIFCDNDRDRAFQGNSIILPPVTRGYLSDIKATEILPVEKREVLFYVRIPCYEKVVSSDGSQSPNLVLLKSVENSLSKGDIGNNREIIVDTRKESCEMSSSERSSSINKMQSSRYCGILPAAEMQSSVELPLAIQSGCIPVFLGPPFHSMPMVLDVEYSKMAVFIHIVDHTKSLWRLDDLHMQDGDLEPDETIQNAPVEVPDVLDAIRHLRNIPATVAGELHKHVVMNIDAFSYHTREAKQSLKTTAADIAIDRMCKYHKHMKEENELKAMLKSPALSSKQM